MVARMITGAHRGHSFGKFWDALAFTRVLKSSKEQSVAVKYLIANQIEVSAGKAAREEFLKNRMPWELRMNRAI